MTNVKTIEKRMPSPYLTTISFIIVKLPKIIKGKIRVFGGYYCAGAGAGAWSF